MLINKKSILRVTTKTIFELIIVFFGVLLAFIASDWRTKNLQQQRFEKTVKVLQHEILDFITYTPIPSTAMEDSLKKFSKEHLAGNYPAPGYYREPRASGAPTAAWEAMLASGAYEILDPTLFYEMTIYYNRVISFNSKFNRYVVRCEDMIINKLYDDQRVFYEGKKLKSEYIFLMQLLKEIILDMKQLRVDALELENKLEEQFSILE